LFAALARLPQLQDWGGLGLAVQAYQRRGVYVIDWLVELAAATRQRFMVRLVKGAYWDSEIKWAQQRGLDDYPVFTRKAATDLSYIACAARLLSAPAQIYPQFATHNSRTLATVLELAGGTRDFEFQKLQGMGDALYRHVLADNPDIACRVYAPVGGYRDLLAYLVRRMLENGANSSFVHQIADPAVPVQRLIVDPLKAMALPYRPNARLKLPRELYPDRLNSRGLDLADERVLDSVAAALAAARASSMPDAKGERLLTIREPANLDIVVGSVIEADASAVSAAIEVAAAAFPSWERTPAHERSACLERAAELMEQRMLALITLCMREAGKTVADALAEVREAIDYCRYYAVQGRAQFGTALALPGPTGEANELRLHGRGVFACISPWNFPLAIFTGQVTAALMAGNAVVAKPAEQTPLIAQEAVAILHEAGVPRQALQLVLGSGEAIGPALTADQRIAGVAFTGSIATATAINRTLAQRGGPIVPLIAETGGQNAMLVDSSALIEQAVADIVTSAFQSAGQRCSSLRLLFVQEEIAGSLIDMLRGAMLELSVGDPCVLQTDIGPIIDAGAKQALDEYVTQLRTRAKLIAQAPLPASSAKGHFVAPVALEIAIADIPDHEVFGPVLHVLRYRAEDIEQVFDAIRRTRCGLTLGIQSRIERFVERVCASVGAGNTYVNRNMIGAVVGVQPFGGEGLSGTGPKAGGPHYLARFALERTLSVNTAAVGGNAHLLADSD
jgi:RHH-type proline utilization regulon transcriptional repressor/proline dehydrogenase/delta 1-pyrroline-5-carboxylate dehydrogenase